MDISADATIVEALRLSNIDPSYRDVQRHVLDQVLATARLTASDVLGISQAEVSLRPDGSSMGTKAMLVVVAKSGIAMAEQKGLLARRVDVQTISYKSMSGAVADEKLYALRRGEMAIQAMTGGSVPLFRVGWNWSQGGPVTASQAAAERDRMLAVIQRAVRGEWDAIRPAAEPAAGRAGSQKAHLMDWAAGLFHEAGISPVREHVESVARTAAVALFVSRVVAFADSRPLPSLQEYCRNLPGELPARFDQFDEIYATWIRLAAEEAFPAPDQSSPEYLRIYRRHQELVDHAINKCLADSRDSFLQGVRDDYGQADAAASQAASGGPRSDPAQQSLSAWEVLKSRGRQAQQHINPLALQHGIESVQGALTESGVAKIDKSTGRMRIKKTGIARAAVQPTRAMRKAVEGAAFTDHLRAYNESLAGRQANPDAEDGQIGPLAAELARYGQARWTGELTPFDATPFDERLAPMTLDQLRGWVSRLSPVAISAGGWAVLGAEYVVMPRDGQLKDLPAYRAIITAALDFQRDSGVWESQLAPQELVFWHQGHGDEPWLPRREPPLREAAVITPLPVGQERRIAVMTMHADSSQVYVSHPDPDRYIAIVEAPVERGSNRGRVRNEADSAGNLYDLYLKVSQAMMLPNHWMDFEFGLFLPFPAPRI
ncbi:MAG TPA: hypothetical protein VMB74_01750 [Streptosporangiaceae bacterium]|nr:hypothetical protein [Streptosporangiaceae bacterium]